MSGVYKFAPKIFPELLNDESITELIFNSANELWLEKDGSLQRLNENFNSVIDYRNFLESILSESNNRVDQTQPVADGAWAGHRYSIVGPWISNDQYRFSLRKHPKITWTLEKLMDIGWCDQNQKKQLSKLVAERKNLFVVGGTGTGKTSVLNSILQESSESTRWIVIEDTPEIRLPNSASLKLLTRQSSSADVLAVTQSELLKCSLRLRPDRILMGEIRGNEAKDFLMAISTGHAGSAASLHADNPWQSLIRLEMLIQMAAPQWQLDSIRKLIKLGIDYIIMTKRNLDGGRVFGGCYRITALEPSGLILDACF